MSKRVLLLTLAVLMALGIYGAVANAGVEGSFTFHISMHPQPEFEICFTDTYQDCVNNYDIPQCVADCVTTVLTDVTTTCISEAETTCDATCEAECTTVPGDVAEIAHEFKVRLEDWDKDGDECKVPDAYDDLYQRLLMIADAADEDAFNDLHQEIADMLADLEEDVIADWCDQGDDFESTVETDIANVDSDLSTLETDVKNFITDPGWEAIDNAFATIDCPDNVQTANVDTDPGAEYIYCGLWAGAMSTWDQIKSERDKLDDKVAAMKDLVDQIEDALAELKEEACSVENKEGYYSKLDALVKLLDQLDEAKEEFKSEVEWLKNIYPTFILYVIGLDNDQASQLTIGMLTNLDGTNVPDELDDILGPTGPGLVYTVLDDIEAAIGHETWDYSCVYTVKWPLIEELQDIIADWDGFTFDPFVTECEVTCSNDCATQVFNTCMSEATSTATTNCTITCTQEMEQVCEEYANEQCWKFGNESNEWQKFDFDFEGILDLSITLSGLTIGNHVAMGMAGIEHYIFSLATTLGALDLEDEFWFAAPYDADMNAIGGLQFVKKRVNASITIGGLTFEGLFLFEDVNFNHPYTPPLLPPMYGFGAVFTIEGTTVSGIGVTSVTGICADPQAYNKVKKYSAPGRVNVLCAWGAIPEGEGGKSPIYFEVEKLYLTGIQVGPLTLDNYTEFRPFHPVSNTLTVSFELMGLSMSVDLYSEDIVSFAFGPVVWTAALDSFLTFIFTDTAGDLTLGPDDSIVVLSYLPIQGADFSNTIVIVPQVGIVEADFSVSIPVAIGTLSAEVDYVGTPLTMDEWTFGWSTDVAGLGFDFNATFKMDGLDEATIDLTIPFSV